MNNSRSNIRHLLIILLFSYVFFFYGMGEYSLKEPDEGRYAEIPREMIELNDYTVPHLNYVRYFEKPPLFYWAVAASYKLFGVNEWSFRFANAFSAFLCMLSLYIFVRRWFGERAAFLSSIVLISSFGFFSMARIVTIDMFFTLWLSLSLFCFLGYYRERKPLFIYFFYVFLAFATLSKGIVAIILLIVTIIIFLLIEKKTSFIKEMRIIKGIIIYGVIALPWFIAISLKESEFFYFFVIDQHFLRFFTAKHKRTGSLFYFLPVLIGGMFPWSILIPRSIISLWKRSEIRLFLIWSGIVLLFFSVSKSKLPPYILPVFPPLAIVIGCFFDDIWDRVAGITLEAAIYIIIFILFAIAPFLFWNTTVIGWVSQISTEAIYVFQSLKVVLICVSILSAIIVFALFFRRFTTYASLFLILSSFSFLFVSLLMVLNIKTIDSLNSTKGLSNTINRNIHEGDLLINYGAYDQTLPFYTRRNVVIAAYKGELEMGSKYKDAKNIFISEDDFIKLLKSEKRVFSVLKTKRLKRLTEKLPENITIIDYQNERCLIKNR
ncbi:MAG: glycosyltransferase family 39 protein [Proteobacteria bacterium]|nr:glycosyltransferase family 39 protein [Pseudomonadota bacterium]